MNKSLLFIITCLLTMAGNLKAQTLDEICALDLPVVVINTVDNKIPTCDYVNSPEGCAGIAIANAEKVPCSIAIRLHGDTLYDSGEYNADTSGATVRVRGNTSATISQKPYKLKLEKKADLLFRGDDSKYKDKEWLLLHINISGLTNFVGLTMNELMEMPYTPGFKPVNVFMNEEYRGLYFLVESVKRNKDCRVDVKKKSGYIIEYDTYWWNEDYYVPLQFPISNIAFTLKYPDSDEATDEQKEYIEDWLKNMQIAVMDGDASDYLFLDTCARWMMTQDLLGNSDGAGSNLFFAKYDTSPEAKAYPPTLWDFDCVCRANNKWSSSHTGSSFFKFMFKYDVEDVFATAFCREWLRAKENDVVNKLIKAINDYAETDEGKAFETSYNLNYIKYKKEDLKWSIADQAKFYEDWFTERYIWIENAMNEQYSEIIKSLQLQNEHYTIVLNNKAVDVDQNDSNADRIYDPLGRATSSNRGIQIINGRKLLRHP